DDGVVALGGVHGEELVLDVLEHPLRRPLERRAQAPPAGGEEEDLPVLLHWETGAKHAQADLLPRARGVDNPGAWSILATSVAPRPEALAVAEARENGVTVREVPDLRHAEAAAMKAGAEGVGLESVRVEHQREQPL